MPDFKPRLSVLLPVYNAEKSIINALESIQSQTFKEFECLVLDDGSTDSTSAKVVEFISNDDRFQLISLPHNGIAHTLNTGINLSKASFLARMDADDISYPTRFEKQYALLTSNPEFDLVSSLVEFGGDKISAGGYARYVDWINSLITYNDILHNQFIESPIAHPSVMMRAESIKKVGGYRAGDFPEDYELWLRLLAAGIKMIKVPEKLLLWADPPERLSRIDARYRKGAFYETKATYLKNWLEANNPFFPKISIWGAGRVTRRRVDFLLNLGIDVEAWIDVNPKLIGGTINGKPIISPDQISEPNKTFIVSFVSSKGARSKIETFLKDNGYILGHHYICAA